MGKGGFLEKLGSALHLEDEDENKNPAEEVEEEEIDETPAEEQESSNSEELGVAEHSQEEPVEQYGESSELQPEPEGTGYSETEEPTRLEVEESEPGQTDPDPEDVRSVNNNYSYDNPEVTLAAARPRKKEETQTKQRLMQNEEEENEEEGRLTIDVYETERDIVVKSTIAGVGHEDLDISITTDSVSIRGKRQRKEKVSEENYFYQECYWGAFSRSIILPTEIDPDKADATLDHGILTIRLPKLAKSQEKKLKVKPAK